MSHESLRILLVHDITGSRREIVDLLSKTGFAQFQLDSVSDLAFRGFRQNYYDLCLIDSAVKGISILKEFRQVGFAPPAIVLTSNTAYEVLNAIRYGAADCLVREALTAGALEESICVVFERIRYKEYKSECARRYLGLVENSCENIYAHDLRGNSSSLSKAFEQLIGYTQEEIGNENFFKILSPECVDSVWRTILRMLADRRPAGYEAIMVTREGQRIPVAVTMHLVYKRGRPIEVQGVVRNLSPKIPAATALTPNDHFSRDILAL